MRDFFYTLADQISRLVNANEIFTAYFAAEDSDFVRFNGNLIRQAGSVRQLELSLDLIEGQKHASGTCNLSGSLDPDLAWCRELVERLRRQRSDLPDDPYLYYATDVQDSEDGQQHELPEAQAAVHDIVATADGLDLVGLWASGTIHRGFANTFGQRNWYSTANFNFDWSCHHRADKAVKASYAGCVWNADELRRKMDELRGQLGLISKEPRAIAPGTYRAYLMPCALAEIFSLLSWNSFGLKSHRTRQTALLKMVQDGVDLNPVVNIIENNRGGVGCCFTEAGFIKPERVNLIEGGAYRSCLVSPRSSREYDVPVNAGVEFPQALELSAGTLPGDEILQRLDTGLYISNLWYSNFSDRNEARITGMTRYACFWVERGKLVRPLNVMRFDESLYRMLGECLLGLTREREFILDPDTYGRRSLSSMTLPGALVEDFRLTL